MKNVILGEDGQPIKLTPGQKWYADQMQKQFDSQHAGNPELANALGGEINFTTLTQVQARVIQQKFYMFAPADYVPLRVGSGDYATQLLTLKEYAVGGGFDTGLIQDGSSLARLADMDAALDSQIVPVVGWAKTITYSLHQIGFGNRLSSGAWDIVEAKERARKRDWDLGIQRTAFLGIAGTTGANAVTGLLTMANITANTTLIPTSISALTSAQLAALPGQLLGAYQTQANYTAYPDRFVIPQNDYNALAAPTNPDYPLVNKLTQLQTAFATITNNPGFKILPSPYGSGTLNGLAKNRYVLYRYDSDTLRMDIPVDYTPTALGTVNGFQFQNVAHARFSGVNAYREREILYIDAASS